jgi:hypothetical protein
MEDDLKSLSEARQEMLTRHAEDLKAMDVKAATETDRLKAEIRVLQAQIRQLQSLQPSDIKMELAKARGELADKERVLADVQTQLRELEQKHTDTRALEDKCNALQRNVALLNDSAATHASALQERDATIADLQSKIFARKDGQTESQQVDDMRRALEETHGRLQQQMAATRLLHTMMQQASVAAGARSEFHEVLEAERARAEVLQAEVTKLKVSENTVFPLGMRICV